MVDGWRRDERTRDIPQSLPCSARLVCQAYHRHPGLYDLPPPHASTRSLLMPTEQGLSNSRPRWGDARQGEMAEHSIADQAPFSTVFLLSFPRWWPVPCSCWSPAGSSCGNSGREWKSPRHDVAGDPTGRVASTSLPKVLPIRRSWYYSSA